MATRDKDKILETTVRSGINVEYYWKKENSEIIPVEVKTRYLNPLVKFSKLFNTRKA